MFAMVAKAQDCPFKAHVSVIDATCFNNGKLVYYIENEDGEVMTKEDYENSHLNEVRIYTKVNETDSALKVYTLGDVDEKFKTVESLFAQEDLQKFNLLDEIGLFVKHASTSTVFKNQIQKNSDSISKATKDNFEKLFKYLEEQTN